MVYISEYMEGKDTKSTINKKQLDESEDNKYGFTIENEFGLICLVECDCHRVDSFSSTLGGVVGLARARFCHAGLLFHLIRHYLIDG